MKYAKLLSLAMLLTGCGVGVDPIQIAGSGTSLPQLGAITTSNAGGFLATNFSAAAPYWTFNTGAAWAGNYLAPADGVVAKVGLTTIASTQTNYVTLIHSARLATRFYGLQNVVVRVGDTIVGGQPVGTFFNATGIIFQVLLDGNPVCPLSFMSDSFRMNFTGFSFNPCQ